MNLIFCMKLSFSPCSLSTLHYRRDLTQSYSFRGRKLNTHLERAIQKAMTELDKQSSAKNVCSEKKSVTSSHKTPKAKLIKIAPAPEKK